MIRNIALKHRSIDEYGWNVSLRPEVWWRENHPGSSTTEGRKRKDGQKRGRKKKSY
jgi:hypothetical protein